MQLCMRTCAAALPCKADPSVNNVCDLHAGNNLRDPAELVDVAP